MMTTDRVGTLHEPPPPPRTLSKEARTVFTECGTFLVQRGLLTSGDIPALVAYSAALARALSLDAHVQEHGLFTADGRPNRAIGLAAICHGAAKGWATALGLVPSGRRALANGPAATPYGTTSALEGLLPPPRHARGARTGRNGGG